METFSRETLRRLNPWYITGLVDGEGSFTYSRSGKENVGLYFAIKLTGRDRILLDSVRSYFAGIGNIYPVKPLIPKGRGGATKAAWYFRATSLKDLERVIEHFDRYPLLGVKAESYRIWREMVQCKKQFRKVDKKTLGELTQKLSALSPRNQKAE